MELEQSALIRKPVRAGRPPKVVEAKDDTPEPVKIDLGFDVDPQKIYIFEVLKKSDIPRFENLGSTVKAFDPEEKRYRDIRYLPTAPSIFPEEWDESFLERPEAPLGFWRNQLQASGEDIRLMEYLTNHPLYDNSPFRVMNRPAMFTLADKEVQEKIKSKAYEIERRALDFVEKTDMTDLMPIARVVFGITEKSEISVRNRLNELVKKPKTGIGKMSNAELLIDNLNNPKLHRTYNIQYAIDMGIINLPKDKGEARLTEGDSFICRIETKNPVNDIVNYTFTDEGKKFYSILRAKV